MERHTTQMTAAASTSITGLGQGGAGSFAGDGVAVVVGWDPTGAADAAGVAAF